MGAPILWTNQRRVLQLSTNPSSCGPNTVDQSEKSTTALHQSQLIWPQYCGPIREEHCISPPITAHLAPILWTNQRRALHLSTNHSSSGPNTVYQSEKSTASLHQSQLIWPQYCELMRYMYYSSPPITAHLAPIL